jgi:RHS repeat-associated protein
MDQVTKTESFGPAIGPAARDSLVVTSQYDAEGNLTQVSRYRGLQFVGYAPLTSTYTYDGAGRKTQDADPGKVENFVYDAAGHVVQRQTTHGTTLFQYDAAGQLSRRIVPEVTYGQTWCGNFFTTQNCFYSFPTIGTSVCVSADTAYFGYDAAGRTTRADNIHARVRRTYKPNGLLATDTLRIRTYYSSGTSPCETDPGGGGAQEFNLHIYPLTYAYNLDGQRTSLTHPEGTQGYSYNSFAGGRGLLTGVTDVASRSYTFDHDAAGRVRVVRYPGSVNDVRTYDATGRMSIRDVTGVLHDEFTYDLQDRITSAYNQYRGGLNAGLTATTVYNGLGAVVAADNFGSGWAETFTVDALGNRLRRQQQGMRPPEHPDYWGIRFSSYLSNGVLESVIDTVLGPSDPYTYEEHYLYDGAGNTDLSYLRETDYYTSGNVFEAGKSYYGADEKLRVYNRHLGIWTISEDTRPGRRGAFEEYRYDAFGRRVLVRSRRGSACSLAEAPVECRSYVERVVWDGDQILLESRADGSDEAIGFESETGGDAAYGRVIYTHAGGIDQPLNVIKSGVAVMPHTNWRGQYEVGTLVNGASTVTCSGTPDCPRIDWPGGATALDGAKTNPGVLYVWWGNLITNKADGSGLLYMRNRYYEPKTGRFTQVDPIGLAGGMNHYGFANGDPVNFSDPFGLCPIPPWTCPGFSLAGGGAIPLSGGATLSIPSAGALLPAVASLEGIAAIGIVLARPAFPGANKTVLGHGSGTFSAEATGVAIPTTAEMGKWSRRFGSAATILLGWLGGTLAPDRVGPSDHTTTGAGGPTTPPQPPDERKRKDKKEGGGPGGSGGGTP